MLYLSTRNKADSFTAHRVMCEACAPDGGLFVPFYLPRCTDKELSYLKNASFSENMERILNYFFSAQISSWEIECYLGKKPVRLAQIGQKIQIAELWHNPNQSYDFLEDTLASNLAGSNEFKSSWVKIGIGIAVLFGLFSELNRAGIPKIDIAVPADDLIAPTSCFYAKYMGLPIEKQIFCFQNNTDAWNLFHHGELSLSLPNVPNLERYLYAVLGEDETRRYLQTSQRRGSYRLDATQLEMLSSDVFPAVIGKNRTESLISQVHNSGSCEIDLTAALSYGGVQDFRSKTGESRTTMLLSFNKPKE